MKNDQISATFGRQTGPDSATLLGKELSTNSANGKRLNGAGAALLNQRASRAEHFKQHRVIRRTGQVVEFDESKIAAAVTKAFVAVATKAGMSPKDLEDSVDAIVCSVLDALLVKFNRDSITAIAIEEIQDQVELALSRRGYHTVGTAYASYREDRAEARRQKFKSLMPEAFNVSYPDGSSKLIDATTIHTRLEAACHGLSDLVDSELLLKRVIATLHEGITAANFDRALVLEANTLSERHYDYATVAARLLLDSLIVEVMGRSITRGEMAKQYPQHLVTMIDRGIAIDRIDPRMRNAFDLQRLGGMIKPERDDQFDFLGLQTLYDRYLLKVDDRRIELPQSMFMRVAMGLALNEKNPTERAIEFYEVLSTFRFMNSTPTLFNSGTTFPQLSSCYLLTVPDDLKQIYEVMSDNAMLSKFAGGLGNDWTPVRAMNSYIKSTGGKSQGVIPFLRVVNDTAVAVNQGGKRKGAVCSYLETWHRDIKEFLELRKNTGDERRRTHDMNTANWIPDLFMQRVKEKGQWTLFSPVDTPDLHDKYGREFEQAYVAYEARYDAGEISGERIEAFRLWQSMLRMLFETGHPWMTFKDPCNIRSPQQHVGVVHSSNLCTEITLNTSKDEIAVCNLGSINLSRHLDAKGQLDEALIKDTVTVGMRMLDNVIDINYYSVDRAANSNKKHRPIGLGQVGYQDCLYKMGIGFDTQEAVDFADRSTEMIAYYAYGASSDLAVERGAYESYEGSLWSQGILPLDSVSLLAQERANGAEFKIVDDWLQSEHLEVNVASTMDWDALRAKIKRDGMRNSNCLAIAPTATIGNIMGASPCIEPTYKNVFVKSNLSGEFKLVNSYLVDDLIAADLWDEMMVSEIKAKDGEIADIKRIPAAIRARHKTVFQLEQRWLIEAAARRQKWIDQSQSLNLYVVGRSGQAMSDMFMLAWQRGLKTTYYCRTLSASSTEKYTTDRTGQQNQVAIPQRSAPQECAINEPDCEACQ